MGKLWFILWFDYRKLEKTFAKSYLTLKIVELVLKPKHKIWKIESNYTNVWYYLKTWKSNEFDAKSMNRNTEDIIDHQFEGRHMSTGVKYQFQTIVVMLGIIE